VIERGLRDPELPADLALHGARLDLSQSLDNLYLV